MDYLKLPIDRLRDELDEVNRDWLKIEGTNLSGIQCYHLETNPPHLLFNTNCPELLRSKLTSILNKYFPDGYIPWIDIEYPEKEIKNLLDKDKVVIEDSVVTIIIDYPLNIAYRGELKSKNGFTKQQLIRLISAHYHKIYEEEELTASIKTVPIKKRTKMYNRNQTNGKYGIWGHDLADLVLDEILVYRNAEGHLTLSLNMES